MNDQQHDPSMTNSMSGAQHNLTCLHAKGGHKQSPLDVMLFSMLSGLRVQEVVNLRYEHLAFGTDPETGSRKPFHFRFPESNGGTDGE